MKDKREIRKIILAARDAMSGEEIAARSDVICTKVMEHSEVRTCSTLMAFLSFGSEVMTDAIIRRAWHAGKRVVAPACLPEEKQLVLSAITCFDDVAPGYRGIREPKPHVCAPVGKDVIDVILVPAVAFDRRGFRVGYGGGYYDRLLAGMAPRVTKIGIAFACQLISFVPLESHDIPVDWVITEEEIIETSAGR